VVARGDSTAYAAAFTAGLAALWLAHHDRQTLLQHYPGAMLPAVFKALLMQHGVDADARWQSHKHGSGIVNALKLLQAPLPAVAPAFATKLRTCGTPRARNDVERLAAYFPEATVSQVRALVRRVLGVSDRHLSDVLASVADEFIFHVATEPAVRARLLALIKPAKCAAGARGAAGLKRLFRQASPLFRSKLAA
jgi:thermitase